MTDRLGFNTAVKNTKDKHTQKPKMEPEMEFVAHFYSCLIRKKIYTYKMHNIKAYIKLIPIC